MSVIDFKTGKPLTQEEIKSLAREVQGDSKTNMLIDLMIQNFYRVDQRISEIENAVTALNTKVTMLLNSPK